MRIPKIKLFHSADRLNGLGLQCSTFDRLFLNALDVSAWLDRPLPSLAMLILLLSCLCLVSCGAPRVEPDEAPAYSQVGYHSAEINLCGHDFFGVAGCSFASGSSANQSVQIQAYAVGEISILSELCHVDWKHRYTENETVTISLADLLGVATLERSNSCTLRVIVSPDPLKDSEQPVFPRTGLIAIEVRSPGISDLLLPPGDQVRSSDVPDSQGFQKEMTASGEFLLTKCDGSRIQQEFAPGHLVLPALDRKTSCKYQYAVRLSDGNIFSGVFQRSVFAANTVLLARPSIQRTPGKICIQADPSATTFVAINNEWSNGADMCADGPGPFKIRVWTVKRNYAEVIQ